MGLFSWKNSDARFLAAYPKVDEEERLTEQLPPVSKGEKKALREAKRNHHPWWG